jgi:hypothetical protein
LTGLDQAEPANVVSNPLTDVSGAIVDRGPRSKAAKKDKPSAERSQIKN